MKTASILALALLASSAYAKDVFVQGHVTKNGTYVAPHHRSSPDSTPMNNYGTQGNYNPYTGQAGTVNPYQQQFQVQQPIISPPSIYQPQQRSRY